MFVRFHDTIINLNSGLTIILASSKSQIYIPASEFIGSHTLQFSNSTEAANAFNHLWDCIIDTQPHATLTPES